MKLILSFLLATLSVGAANLLPNSSFEVGGRSGWSWGPSDSIRDSPDSAITTADAFHGVSSWELSGNASTNVQSCVSAPLRLQPGRTYTVSIYAKNSTAGAYNLQLGHENAFGNVGPSGDSGATTFQANTAGWTRATNTWTATTNSQFCVYRVYFNVSVGSYPSLLVRFDAAQLEEASSPSAYAPASTVEIGLPIASRPSGNTYFVGESVEMPVRFWNDTATNAPLVVDWRTVNFWGALDQSGAISASIPAGAFATNIPLASARKGTWQLRAWIRDGQTMNEVQYCVLAATNTLSSSTAGLFGIHAKASPYYQAQARRMGFTWNRSLSGIGSKVGQSPVRWSVVEAVDDVFVYDDAAIAAMVDAGMNPLMVLGSSVDTTPAYALSGGLPVVLPYWTNYVHNMVSHYGPLGARYWEIYNEPEGEGGLGAVPELYVDLATNALAVIKAADASAVVGGPTVAAWYYANSPSYASNVLGPLWLGTKFDFITHHTYPGLDRGGDWRSRKGVESVAATNGFSEAWNTESGGRLWTGYRTPLFDELYINDGSMSPVESNDARTHFQRGQWLGKTFGRMAGVTKKSFWYDGRAKGSFGVPISYSPFEWDGTLRPWGAMASAFIALFEESILGGTVEFGGDIDDNGYVYKEVEAHVFAVGTNAVAAIYANHRTNVYLVTSSESPLEYFDAIGNPVTYGSGALVSFLRPAYFRVAGGDTNALLTGIGVASASDTEAPVVQVDTAPIGAPPASGEFRFRWSAVDNVGIQYLGVAKTNSLLFRWKLHPTDAAFSAWSATNGALYAAAPTSGTIFVEATDPAGNIGSNYWSWPYASPASATANTINVGTLNIGQ